MRHLCLSVAMSLDGCIARADGGYDWIPMDPDIDMGALFARFDTVVMGRGSYEAAKAMGEAGSTGLPTIVCSRTLRQEDCPGVTVAPDAATAVRALKAAPGGDIWLFGGGDLFRSLLAARLVDQVQVAIVPVLLGGGLPLLPWPGDGARLTLRTHRVYEKSGTVMLEYEVARTTDP